MKTFFHDAKYFLPRTNWFLCAEKKIISAKICNFEDNLHVWGWVDVVENESCSEWRVWDLEKCYIKPDFFFFFCTHISPPEIWRSVCNAICVHILVADPLLDYSDPDLIQPPRIYWKCLRKERKENVPTHHFSIETKPKPTSLGVLAILQFLNWAWLISNKWLPKLSWATSTYSTFWCQFLLESILI